MVNIDGVFAALVPSNEIGNFSLLYRENIAKSPPQTDLVLSTESDRVGEVCVLEPFPKCHHCVVVFEYVLQFDIPGNSSSKSVRILWSKEDYRRIFDCMLAVDWEFEFDSRLIEACFSYFVHVMKILIDRFVPSVTYASLPIWMKGPPRWLERAKASK